MQGAVSRNVYAVHCVYPLPCSALMVCMYTLDWLSSVFSIFSSSPSTKTIVDGSFSESQHSSPNTSQEPDKENVFSEQPSQKSSPHIQRSPKRSPSDPLSLSSAPMARTDSSSCKHLSQLQAPPTPHGLWVDSMAPDSLESVKLFRCPLEDASNCNAALGESHCCSTHVASPGKERSQMIEGNVSGTALVRRNKQVHWTSPGGVEGSPEGAGFSMDETQSLIERLEATASSLSPVLNSLPSLHSVTPTLDKLLCRKVRRQGTRSWMCGSLPSGVGCPVANRLPLSSPFGEGVANEGISPVIKESIPNVGRAGVCTTVIRSSLGVTSPEADDNVGCSGPFVGSGEKGAEMGRARPPTKRLTLTDPSHLAEPSNCKEEAPGPLNLASMDTAESSRADGSPQLVAVSPQLKTSQRLTRSCKREAMKQPQSVPITDSHSCPDGEKHHSSKVTDTRQRGFPQATGRVTRRMAALQKAFLEECGLPPEQCSVPPEECLPAPKRSRTSKSGPLAGRELPGTAPQGCCAQEPSTTADECTAQSRDSKQAPVSARDDDSEVSHLVPQVLPLMLLSKQA